LDNLVRLGGVKVTATIHPLFDLTGRVAVVTGGGSGLGREFCDVLAEFGADVVCPDVYKDRAEETCGIIKKYGHRTMALEVDVSKYDQVQGMFKQVMASFGRLDILVNNAGVAPPPIFVDEVELKDWHRVIDTDLHGVFHCLKEGLKIMRKQGRGSIINISSVAGLHAADPSSLPQAAYVAAKHAVVGLTKQAAAEYGQFGIRVNCIAPGLHVGTKLPESQGPAILETREKAKAREQRMAQKIALRRPGLPKEMRGLILYLASDSSSYVTGEIIVQDGGMGTCV
jgi:NAD(P)-dependent dehydrogenase (short-subunit alcohol dehydrogenase family)